MNINDLNDDCLKQVFSWLSFRDKVKCERVCKLWKLIIEEVLTQQLTIKISNCFQGFKSITLFAFLQKVNEKCFNLKAIDLNDNEIDEKSLDIVFNRFHRLTKFSFKNSETFNNSIIKVFISGKNTTNLTEIFISNQNIDDKSLKTILKTCPKLKSLDVSKNEKINGKSSLQYLSSNIISLDISECRYIREDGFNSLVYSKGKYLKQLRIGTYISKKIIKSIANNLKQLTELHINAYYYPKTFESQDLSSIGRLERLQHLYLHNMPPLLQNDFDSPLIGILKAVHNLKTLSLIVTQISDKSLEILSKFCPKLESFEYQYSSYETVVNNELTNEGALSLCAMYNLKTLSLTGTAFDDNSVKNLLQSNQSLKYIYFSYCENITESSLKYCINFLESNSQNKLIVKFKGLALDSNKVNENDYLKRNLIVIK